MESKVEDKVGELIDLICHSVYFDINLVASAPKFCVRVRACRICLFCLLPQPNACKQLGLF